MQKGAIEEGKHEMNMEHFIDDMNRRYDAIEQETKLKTIREN